MTYSLSNEVIIHKRIVYDTFMMFGDVGGLLDFMMYVVIALFSTLNNSLLKTSQVSKLFYSSKAKTSRARVSSKQAPNFQDALK